MQIPPDIEARLEEAARARQKSVAELFEEIVREWLDKHRQEEDRTELDEERQRQLRAAALQFAGVIDRDDVYSPENARSAVRDRIARRRAG
jgi:hypothetical protein